MPIQALEFNEWIKRLSKFLTSLGIKYKNINLYIPSFIHSSFANENELFSYEKNEWYGDTILNYLVKKHLFKIFPYYDEGKLSELSQTYISNSNLVYWSKKIKLNELVLTSKKMEVIKTKIVSDVFEALIGSIELDLGIKAVKLFFNNIGFYNKRNT